MRESRFVVSALCCGVVAIIVAACGGGGSSGTSDTPGPAGGTDAGISTVPTVDGGNCGRNTTLCPTGASCKVTQDCVKGDVCINSVCNPPPATCTDKSKDGDETDVDCGGSCPQCADGKACAAAKDCVDAICNVTCQAPSCTDGLQNGPETAVDCGGTCPTKCADGKGCKTGADCTSGACGKDNLCAAPSSTDGVKNGTETDTDCGGGAPTNAPACATGKKCAMDPDCVWGHCNAGICGGHVVGTKDGDETDINCGGKMSPACDWFLGCLVDKDCSSNVCDSTKHCSPGASCKTALHGGQTCGTGEFGDMNSQHTGPGGVLQPGYETCCRSLPVPGYADAEHAGKTTYVDKYEITAGRMRTFIETISAANGGVPDIKGYMAAHRPAAKWNNGWEDALPQANAGSNHTFTVGYASGNLLYPGQDQYIGNHPTQNTWWIRATGPNDINKQGPGQNGMYAVDNGVYNALMSAHFFPEYFACNPALPGAAGCSPGAAWGSTDYAAGHAFNCYNGAESYAWNTYWFPPAVITTYTGDGVMVNTKEQYDEKAMNCSPLALYAAFCAWDGGQLMTGEVADYISGNTVQPIYDAAYPNGKYAPGNAQCGSGNTLNTFSDGGNPCYNVYFFPGYDNVPAGLPHAGLKNTYDSSARIAPPGRIVADMMTKNAGDEPWMDMIGNLEEAVIKKGETIRFDYRGFGAEYGSITHHRNQQTTPRYKSGSFGARCMRFK
jgi:hypothetical protein